MKQPRSGSFFDLFRCFDRGTVPVAFRGHTLALRTGHGLFSADRLDDGTRLLLDHLPDPVPPAVLDLGCGYGALGLPIARAYPSSEVTLIDRDVVAVRYAERNAARLNLANTRCTAGLGSTAADARWDLILCNVPARIGEAGIGALLGRSAARVQPGGQVRCVVIHDLEPTCEALAARRGWAMHAVARGKRHTVFSIAAREESESPKAAPKQAESEAYFRDRVTFDDLVLDRPHDISEDPSHLRDAIPLLLDFLPRDLQHRHALVVRLGYGTVAVRAAQRGAHVVATDRDLLQLAYTERNAARAGMTVQTRESAWLPENDGAFDVVALELSSASGQRVAEAELAYLPSLLTPNGAALVLGRKTLLTDTALPPAAHATRLADRGAWQLLRITPKVKPGAR